MKKMFFYLALCNLCFSALGQGTAYITKSYTFSGYSQMIRQYNNNPGQHVVYFTDTISGRKGYIGITDIYNMIRYVQICHDCIIRDIDVFGDSAYFCGQTFANNSVFGWVDLITMTVYFDSSWGLTSLDNIEVYRDATSNIRIVGYGKMVGLYIGFDYTVQTSSFWYYNLPYLPRDLTLTDNYSVFVGDCSPAGITDEIVIQPLQKNLAFPPSSYMPYNTYLLGTATEEEPYKYHLRVVDIGNDYIATLTHRYTNGSGFFNMVIREYDVSNASTNYDIPMTASYHSQYSYSAIDFYDFQYDASNMTYTVLQNYEVSPSSYQDIVTRIDFSSGMPTSIYSDHLALPYQVMKSMSLSDSAMYVVYGYDATSKANVFWKDSQNSNVPGGCSNYDYMPFDVIPMTTPIIIEENIVWRNMNLSPNPISAYTSSERILTICH